MSQHWRPQTVATTTLALLFAMTGLLASASPAYANHPVLVEGNCPGPASRTLVLPLGTCGDYDGDGRVGTAEDDDGPDRVFGTINAALGLGSGAAAGTGANQNGMVTIVASGTFNETVAITAANGNVVLQAAPGVDADIDAVLQGAATLQGAPGIIVNAPADRYVVLRNLTVRNWTTGIQVLGDSRVTIEDVRLDGNVNFGIHVRDNAVAAISRTDVQGTGRRVGGATPPATNDFPRLDRPAPGTGIAYADASSGVVTFGSVTHSFAAGISSDSRGKICVSHVTLADNDPSLERVSRSEDCDGRGNDRSAAEPSAPRLLEAGLAEPWTYLAGALIVAAYIVIRRRVVRRA